ncbi:MAG: hypothetical protein INR71_01330, partial [Terriglobus roseus]|nr:hypothetical protein [Terriglobus roseus]
MFGVRMAIVAYYNWRISSSQDHLDGLYKERDSTIEKLKKATKYDSTQQLLDKYGSPRPASKAPGAGDGKQQSPRTKRTGPPEPRVFRQPPPTANIPRNQPAAPSQASPSAASPQAHLASSSPSTPHSPQRAPAPGPPGAEFAPNAFADAPPQYAPAAGAAPRWYDRLMDALLGDDETLARNRVALICRHCRLVNGQAPPGARGLADVGRWRCGACGGWNGEDDDDGSAAALVRRLAAEQGSGG